MENTLTADADGNIVDASYRSLRGLTLIKLDRGP